VISDSFARAAAEGANPGPSTFVKFHWKPVLGTHSLDWDESVKIMGADPAPAKLPSGEPDPGMLIAKHGRAYEALPAFIKAIARHRHHERETDPPAL